MLEINLLPVQQLKKRAQAKQHLAVMVLLFFSTILLFAGLTLWQKKEMYNLEQYRSWQQQEKQDLEPILIEVEALKRKKEELQRKTDIIHAIQKDSLLTVHILDDIASRIDNQRTWLTFFEQQDKRLTLIGVALDNQTIAQFMDKLAASDFITEVSLADSSLYVISGRNLKRFTLNCIIAYPNDHIRKRAIQDITK